MLLEVAWIDSKQVMCFCGIFRCRSREDPGAGKWLPHKYWEGVTSSDTSKW